MRARPLLIVGAAVALGSIAVLVAEAVLGFSGDGSPQPAGSANGTYGDGAGPPIRLVILGDSTAVAVGAGSVENGYPHRLAAALATDLRRRVEVTVLAVSGARIADVRHSQLPRVAGLQPNVVLIAAGGNDVTHLTNADDARRDLREVIAGAESTGARTVVVGVPAMGAIRRVAQPLRWLVGLLGRRYDDIWREETVSAHAARVELAAETEQPFTDDPQMFAKDGFHPSAKGYALWADVIEPVLRAAAASVP